MKSLKKRKKTKTFLKVITLWYNLSMDNVSHEDLFEPRPKLGTVCYFLGAIDSLCQRWDIDDASFAELSVKFFMDKEQYFFNDIANHILMNYFGKNQRVEFATLSMIKGGNAFRDWIDSSVPSSTATETLSELITEWKRKPNLGVDEVPLLTKID